MEREREVRRKKHRVKCGERERVIREMERERERRGGKTDKRGDKGREW